MFFDDILVYSKSREEHKDHLRVALTALKEHQLVINPKKCILGQTQVEYLGHIITTEGVKADPSKISSMLQRPTPHNLKALR